MSDPLTVFPEGLAGEYSALEAFRQTSTAHVYRARDGLDASVLITEAFDQDLSQRDPSGGVSAKPDCGEVWNRWLENQHEKIALWSRLVHPALRGIDQVFMTNGTLYVVTPDNDSQSLAQLLPDISVVLEPQQKNVAADSLIDLLAHLHAFGIIGLGIDPKALFLDAQEASLFLSLQPYLEGSIAAFDGTQNSAATDAKALARTVHCLLTSREPERPYKPLQGRVGNDTPAPLIATLDILLGSDGPPADFRVRDWKAQAGNAQGHHTAKRLWLPLAAAALVLGVGIAAWLGFLQGTAPDSAMPDQSLAIEDAGSWQMDLPLQIVSANHADGAFVLKLSGGSAEFSTLNPWVQDGMTVTHINGAPVTSPVDLRELTLSSVDSVESAELISLIVQDPNLPLQNNVAVVPHVWRQKVYGAIQLREQASIDGWQLIVTRVDPGITLPLKVGDVVMREQIADIDLRRFADFDRVLHRLEGVTNPSLTLAIRRKDNSELVVGFAAERLLTKRTAVSEQ